MNDIHVRRYITRMSPGNKSGRDGADDYYVSGERKQGIIFYMLSALIIVLVLYIALKAYGDLVPLNVERIRWFLLMALALAVGATAGIVGYSAFNSYRFFQVLVRNSILTSPQAFPEVHGAALRAAERLSMEAPAVYVTQSPTMNAYMVRVGLKKKIIMVNTGLLKAMEENELLFILGHELSHVKYGRWRRIPGLGLPYIIGAQFNEYRCDRGGHVASGDLDASVRALLKLVTGKEFIDRIDIKSFTREKEEAPSTVLQRMASHPMVAARVRELLRFHDSPAYRKDY